MEVVAKLLRDQCKHRDGVVIKLHDKRAALENLGKHLGLFKENTALNVNISLADLVNGSYKIEKGRDRAARHRGQGIAGEQYG